MPNSGFNTPVKGYQNTVPSNFSGKFTVDGHNIIDGMVLDYLQQPRCLEIEKRIHIDELSKQLRMPLQKIRDEHGHHDHESYYGDRDTDSLVQTMKNLVKSISVESQKLALKDKSDKTTKKPVPQAGGCRIEGFVRAKKEKILEIEYVKAVAPRKGGLFVLS